MSVVPSSVAIAPTSIIEIARQENVATTQGDPLKAASTGQAVEQDRNKRIRLPFPASAGVNFQHR